MQLHRPRGPRHRVVERGPGAHLVHRELVRAPDPAGLPPSGEPVGPHPGLAEGLGELGLEQGDRGVGLVPSLEHRPRGADRVERRVDVRDVQHRGAAPGEEEREPAAPQQPETPRCVRPNTAFHLSGLGLVRLVEVLHDDLLAAVDRPRRHPAGQPGPPRQRRVAARVHPPGGPHPHVPVSRPEVAEVTKPSRSATSPSTAPVITWMPKVAHGSLQPAAEHDLVVENRRGVPAREVRPRMVQAPRICHQNAVGELARSRARCRIPPRTARSASAPSARRSAAASRRAPLSGRAAPTSIAAEHPAIPAPTTQISPVISCNDPEAGRATASSRSSVSSCAMSGTLSLRRLLNKKKILSIRNKRHLSR